MLRAHNLHIHRGRKTAHIDDGFTLRRLHRAGFQPELAEPRHIAQLAKPLRGIMIVRPRAPLIDIFHGITSIGAPHVPRGSASAQVQPNAADTIQDQGAVIGAIREVRGRMKRFLLRSDGLTDP